MTVIAPEREVQEAFQVLEPIVDDEGGIKAIDVVKDLVKLVFFLFFISAFTTVTIKNISFQEQTHDFSFLNSNFFEVRCFFLFKPKNQP